ncbi:hypothetical protein OG937_15090 [Streptomyces sp. NBC_00510]
MERARRDISVAVALALLLLPGGVFVPAVPYRRGLETVGTSETAPPARPVPAVVTAVRAYSTRDAHGRPFAEASGRIRHRRRRRPARRRTAIVFGDRVQETDETPEGARFRARAGLVLWAAGRRLQARGRYRP